MERQRDRRRYFGLGRLAEENRGEVGNRMSEVDDLEREELIGSGSVECQRIT